jgi:hypothetical protein
MKEEIRKVLWDFVAGEVTDSEAVQQVLDLFSVVGRSEQLLAFLEWVDQSPEENANRSREDLVKDYLSQ